MIKLPYERSFSTLGCPELSWEELGELNRRYGIRLLELRALGGDLDLPGYLERTFVQPAAWAEAVEQAGFRVCGLSTSLKMVGGEEADRAAFLQFLPWAEAVGGVPLRVFDGGSVAEGLSGGRLDEALELIRWWRDERMRNSWSSDIIIEMHDSTACSNELKQLQSALGEDPVDVLWDTHHTWKKGGEPIAETWAAVGQWVKHVHVKDSIREPSARHPYTYVLPGSGEFPMQQTLCLLRDSGYDAVVSLEWEKVWHPYLGSMDSALEAMASCFAAAGQAALEDS